MPQQGYQHQEYPKWIKTGENPLTGEPVGRLVHGPEEFAAVAGPKRPGPGRPAKGEEPPVKVD